MKFVYGIHKGTIYEGGGLHHEVFLNESDALIKAQKLVKQEQKEQDAIYGDKETTIPYKWTLEGENRWTNGLYEIVIVKLKVL